MYVMAFSFAQSLPPDRIEKTCRGAVIENRRGRGGGVVEFDVDRVPLAGADSRAVYAEGEALFVVVADNLFEHLSGEVAPAGVAGAQQFLDFDPAGIVESNADHLQPMTKDEAEKMRLRRRLMFTCSRFMAYQVAGSRIGGAASRGRRRGLFSGRGGRISSVRRTSPIPLLLPPLAHPRPPAVSRCRRRRYPA